MKKIITLTTMVLGLVTVIVSTPTFALAILREGAPPPDGTTLEWDHKTGINIDGKPDDKEQWAAPDTDRKFVPKPSDKNKGLRPPHHHKQA